MNPMEVTINQEKHSLEEKMTLSELVEYYGYSKGNGVAIAINDKVIPKDKWEEYTLSENDEITLIQATQGG